jgi:Xaa-Pro aminopeptidase
MNFPSRIARVRARMAELEVDTLLLSVGPDLPYLTGYEAMPLERLTMLVLPRRGDAARRSATRTVRDRPLGGNR